MSSARVGMVIVRTHMLFYGQLQLAQEIGGGFLHGRLRPAEESMG